MKIQINSNGAISAVAQTTDDVLALMQFVQKPTMKRSHRWNKRKCSVCGDSFIGALGLGVHMKKHKGA